MNIPRRVFVREVCPRDGFQNEDEIIPAVEKITIIDKLSACGFGELQYTAFVSPKAIPNLFDAEQVSAGINRRPGVIMSALVINERGFDRALTAGVRHLEFTISATDAHNKSNANATTQQALRRLSDCLGKGRGCAVTPSLAVAFGCPFEGRVPFERVHDIVKQFVSWGLSDVCVADTIGAANPRAVYETCARLLDIFPELRIRLHLHDARGMALANIVAAMQAGVTSFDASAAGLGGCPFAPGAPGNIATEDLVGALDLMGIETGVDLAALLDAARVIAGAVGHSNSRSLTSGIALDQPV